jgi:hypothetical protein
MGRGTHVQASIHAPISSYGAPAKRVNPHRHRRDIEAIREMLDEVTVAASALYALHPEPASVEGLYTYIRDALVAASAKIERFSAP